MKTVAIAFDLNFRHAAKIFGGASDYIQEAQLDWQLMPLNFGFEARLMELARSGQLSGALGTFVSDGWVQGLLETGVPAINMFNFSKIDCVPNLGPDDYATGQAAAQHLKAQGAQRFVFAGADGVHYTCLREAGFKDALEGEEVINIHPGPSLQQELHALVETSLLSGVFCSNDLTARGLIIEARSMGIDCGKDMLVIGVDNDPSESIFAGIGISSFEQPIQETGYLAAKALHEVIEHGSVQSKLAFQSPIQLIPRESSLASNRARIGQLAANTVQEQLSDPSLDAAELARRVGTSRRSLELAVQEQFSTSPYRLLTKSRVELAERLLRRTRLPIMEVGIRCGYPEPHHFSAWFKKQSGMAPKVFRESLGTPSSSSAQSTTTIQRK